MSTCGQVICEVPDDCVGGGDVSGGAMPNACGDTYQAQSAPCQVPPEFQPCPPMGASGGDGCNCGDFNGCCYQQPPRALPIRPVIGIYRSTAPMETDTIYKRSYFPNCGGCFRAQPINPCVTLHSSTEPMEKCTTQKLSYMPPCNVGRTNPILPKENGLRFNGPLYAMTSQKHDFVPKCYSKRTPIRPINGIYRNSDPLERCTINQLSYMPNDICQNPPPKPIVQTYNYVRPTGPIDKGTIQKLSYMPVCLPAKEAMPWAMQERHEPPPLDSLCTTYKLSYIPNCNTMRTAAIVPLSGIKCFGTDSADDNTVYNLSYMPVDGRCCRPAPILPLSGLQMPSGEMEKCTIQKLSYQPNCRVERTRPIRPKENSVKPHGPQHYMTTQKHDFSQKPNCRRPLIIPQTSMCRPTSGIDKATINKLSYMPVNVCENPRPAAIIPTAGICRNSGPMEQCTTYKLSYMPNCVPPREHPKWAGYSSYVKPTAPIEKCTIQKLSYGPPGNFSRCGDCRPGGAGASAFPKAGIC